MTAQGPARPSAAPQPSVRTSARSVSLSGTWGEEYGFHPVHGINWSLRQSLFDDSMSVSQEDQ